MSDPKRWMPVAVVLACLGLTGPALAEPLQPEDFATGQRLLTSGHEPFYRLELHADIYSGSARPDVGDLRVFNSNGEVLPYTLLPAADLPPHQSEPVELQAWQLPEAPAASGTSAQASISGAGVVLSWSRQTDQPDARLLLVSHDGVQPLTLSSLRLEWETQDTGWEGQVRIETSDDADGWTEVANGLPLLDLVRDGRHLRIDTLQFQTTTARYWRLTLTGNTSPRLVRVTGRTQSGVMQAALTWLKPRTGEVQPDGSRVFRFDPPQPANALRWHLPQENTVMSYTLSWRRSSKAPWQELPQDVAWRLNRNGEMQESAPRLLDGEVIGELRLQSASGWGKGEPLLELARHTQYLVFNARGQGPWLVAWGAASVDSAAIAPQLLLPGYGPDLLSVLPEAVPAETVTLGGEQRRLEPGRAARHALWKTRALWAALCAAALLLAAMAWHMWRTLPLAAPAPSTDKDSADA